MRATERATPQQEAGLCLTCIRRTHCGYAAAPRGNVWHCEEFEVGAQARTVHELPAPEEADLVRAREMGLCFNCANLPTCRLPKPEGGIWHCEEYE